MYSGAIDWSSVQGLPYKLIECECGQTWKGHTKVEMTNTYPKTAVVVSEVACGGCGENDQIKKAQILP